MISSLGQSKVGSFLQYRLLKKQNQRTFCATSVHWYSRLATGNTMRPLSACNSYDVRPQVASRFRSQSNCSSLDILPPLVKDWKLGSNIDCQWRTLERKSCQFNIVKLPNKGIRQTFYLTRRLRALARRWPRVSTPKQCREEPRWSKFWSCQCQECSEMTTNWAACLQGRRAAVATRTHPSRCLTKAEILNPSSWRSNGLCSRKSSGPRPFLCLLSQPGKFENHVNFDLEIILYGMWTLPFPPFNCTAQV